MINILKLELKRSFKNNSFVLALGIGCLIAFLQFVIEVYPLSLELDEYMRYSKGMIYPGWLYSSWIGGNSGSLYSFLFFFILPILAAMPFGGSFFSDVKSGFIQNICTRVHQKKYIIAKSISAFLSSGIVIILPVCLNFYLSSMFLPSLKPEIASYDSLISGTSTFPQIYYNFPFLYVCLFVFIIFIFSGLIGMLALAASYFFNYQFLVILGPFFGNLFFMTLFDFLNMPEYKLNNFLNPSYSLNTMEAMLITLFVFIVIVLLFFIIKSWKADIY